jgi:hypothetical protein
MTTLKDLIKRYGSLTKSPVVGDQVLFERAEDSGTCSINYGEVTGIIPMGEFKEALASIRGIHTFFPDGSDKPFRGRTQWAFPLTHLTKPITERVVAHLALREKLAAQTRAWIASLDQ